MPLLALSNSSTLFKLRPGVGLKRLEESCTLSVVSFSSSLVHIDGEEEEEEEEEEEGMADESKMEVPMDLADDEHREELAVRCVCV